MSLLKRLFGISESSRAEILTKVSDEMWVSTSGDVITRVSNELSVSTKGTVYTRVDDSTVAGSDGSLYMSIGDCMSSDGSLRSGGISTGRGAIFNDDHDC